MNSTSWLLHLIKGTKNLSPDTTQRIAKALKMSKAEADYFELMVPFTQAKTNAAKDQVFQRMLALKRKLKITRIGEEQYDYYLKWYHPVVRSLVTKVDFGDDFALLGRCLVPAISAAEAKKSVRLLEKLGLILKGEGGRYVHQNAVVSTGDEVGSLNVINYHKQVSRLAEAAHDRSPREERDISALTLGISAEDFAAIKGRIQAFRKEIMEMALASKDADRVYQLNFQFFPVGKGQG
jgi:uncharacterized protein (TIGR02147 family)